MKYDAIFKDKLGCNNADDVFAYLIENLKSTITKWDYFVNWDKAFNGMRSVEINLNILNYLVGKDSIEDEALLLFNEHPQVMTVIPVLLACRDNKFQLLKEYQNGQFIYEHYNFSDPSKISAEKAVEFLSKSGFFKHLKNENIKSLVDYVFGVEVGLDSNGRKNRGGTAMEDIVEFFVNKLCEENEYEYMTQATAPKIKSEWGFDVTVDKSTRRLDFAIKANNRLVLIETNFYSGGGSKLKSTAGEYRTLYNCIKSDGHKFIWITDGAGWKTTQRPLQETFNEIDYILSLDMIEKGLLGSVL